MQVQDYSRAAELFATAYQINPSYLIALKNLASVYMKMGDAEWAVQIMEQYVQLVAQDAQAWNDLGSYNYVLERFAFAQVSFERSLAIQESVYAFLGLGSSYQMQGNFSLAESNYLKALEIDSTNVLVHFNLADMYLQLERYDLASHAFKQVLALEPDNVIAKQTLELMQKHNYNNPQ
jgi:Tfp pilus assembly protein PilF